MPRHGVDGREGHDAPVASAPMAGTRQTGARPLPDTGDGSAESGAHRPWNAPGPLLRWTNHGGRRLAPAGAASSAPAARRGLAGASLAPRRAGVVRAFADHHGRLGRT